MIDGLIYAITLLLSLGIVGGAGKAGYLNGAFQRGFAGVGTQIVSSTFLLSYTNFETFLRACWNGILGVHGFLFIASLGILIVVWVNNLVEYRQAIV